MGRGSPFKVLASMCLGFALALGRPRQGDRHAAHDLRPRGAAGRLRVPDRRHRPVRHRRDPVVDGERPEVLGHPCQDPPAMRCSQTWKKLLKLLGDLHPQLHRRLLDGHHAGRRHARFLHELRPRQALLQARRQLRQGRDRGRRRARDGRACRRHQRAAADADARHSRIADGGRAARRPADLGPAARARCCSSSRRTSSGA